MNVFLTFLLLKKYIIAVKFIMRDLRMYCVLVKHNERITVVLNYIKCMEINCGSERFYVSVFVY